MGNMSYCRYRNTLTDLIDCKEDFESSILDNDQDDDLSRDEAQALVEMIDVMREFMNLMDTHSEIDCEDIHDIGALRRAFPTLIRD